MMNYRYWDLGLGLGLMVVAAVACSSGSNSDEPTQPGPPQVLLEDKLLTELTAAETQQMCLESMDATTEPFSEAFFAKLGEAGAASDPDVTDETICVSEGGSRAETAAGTFGEVRNIRTAECERLDGPSDFLDEPAECEATVAQLRACNSAIQTETEAFVAEVEGSETCSVIDDPEALVNLSQLVEDFGNGAFLALALRRDACTTFAEACPGFFVEEVVVEEVDISPVESP